MRSLTDVQWYDLNGNLVESYGSSGDTNHLSILNVKQKENSQKPQWRTLDEWKPLEYLDSNLGATGPCELRLVDTDTNGAIIRIINIGFTIFDLETEQYEVTSQFKDDNAEVNYTMLLLRQPLSDEASIPVVVYSKYKDGILIGPVFEDGVYKYKDTDGNIGGSDIIIEYVDGHYKEANGVYQLQYR